MSPFAKQLHESRVRAGFRQKDLAELLGYEQSYISALELGLKGPPTQEFVNKLVKVLELNEDDQGTLEEAVEASQRKVELPNEAPIELFWLCHKLRQQIDGLHPVQIELMTTALNLPTKLNMPSVERASRIRRRSEKHTSLEDKK